MCTLCLASFTQYNYLEMNIWVVPNLRLQPIKLLWTLMYMSLCRHMLLFILSKYLGVEGLDHIISLYLTLQESAELFSKVVDHYAFCQQYMKVPVCPHLCPNTWYVRSVLSIIAILWGMYLIVVIICVFSNNLQCLAYFHVLICYLYIFSGEMSS